jgi:adenylate kinase family enzyme
MALKVFILGRPGSGKSAAYRVIDTSAKDRGWKTTQFNDYDILQDMFRFEKLFQPSTLPKKFLPTEHNGFDVLDFSVLDTVLRELEKKVQFNNSRNNSDELITIEFARDDYAKAFSQFRPSFLKDAYFLFIHTDIKTCIERVHHRVAHPTYEDDHFVSEEIIRSYYKQQNMPLHLLKDSGIDLNKVKIIHNKGSEQAFSKKINELVDGIISEQEAAILVSPKTLKPHREHPIQSSANELKLRARVLLGV